MPREKLKETLDFIDELHSLKVGLSFDWEGTTSKVNSLIQRFKHEDRIYRINSVTETHKKIFRIR
jgi:hypothetical protein